jgi:hypothetical protein
MLSSTILLKLVKFKISNIQTHIEISKVLEHKKYQMMNQLNFNKTINNP